VPPSDEGNEGGGQGNLPQGKGVYREEKSLLKENVPVPPSNVHMGKKTGPVTKIAIHKEKKELSRKALVDQPRERPLFRKGEVPREDTKLEGGRRGLERVSYLTPSQKLHGGGVLNLRLLILEKGLNNCGGKEKNSEGVSVEGLKKKMSIKGERGGTTPLLKKRRSPKYIWGGGSLL